MSGEQRLRGGGGGGRELHDPGTSCKLVVIQCFNKLCNTQHGLIITKFL